jgi:hypothetical protein
MALVYVELGPMSSKAGGIDADVARTIMQDIAKSRFEKAPGFTLDPKTRAERRFYFDATLNKVEDKGGNTFATIMGLFAVLPKKNLMGGATLTTTVGVGGMRSPAEEAVKETMSELITKAIPAVLRLK